MIEPPEIGEQAPALSEAGMVPFVDEGVDSNLQSLCEQLAEMIVATEAEFNQLSAFVRPLARSGFKNKAGQSIQDWTQTAKTLREGLNSPASLANELSRLDTLFDKLISYYQGVPAETARFTRESETLQTVERISGEQLALIRKLKAATHQLVIGNNERSTDAGIPL